MVHIRVSAPLLRALTLLLISFACLSVLTAPAAPPVTEEKARPAGELSAEDILASSRTVMHGLGQLSGTSVLNCREGFDRYYARGARVFEVDLRMTSDGQVVLRHDWRGG